MATKQQPRDGMFYDEETHQWVAVPLPTEPEPAAPSPAVPTELTQE